MSKAVTARLKALADKRYAAECQRFFKTGKGEYAEGDQFIGVRVPQIRALARDYQDAPATLAMRLLKSKIHEQRLLALVLLTERFKKGEQAERKTIYQFYLDNIRYINNWDLVDVSAHKIVGAWLHHRSRRPLYRLAKLSGLWQRRIAIVATAWFIAHDDFDDTFGIAELLLEDDHDLIHKAVGWMLREVGKRDRQAQERFLRRYYQAMPRTMLRYAIERFPEALRKRYLQGRI